MSSPPAPVFNGPMCWMVPAALLAASPADGTGTLLVLPVKSAALDPTERGVLEALVTDEVARRTTMTVITVAEIDELIDLQKKRQSLGAPTRGALPRSPRAPGPSAPSLPGSMWWARSSCCR